MKMLTFVTTMMLLFGSAVMAQDELPEFVPAPDFDLPAQAEESPVAKPLDLVRLGNIYLTAPKECVTELGGFNNLPAASVKVMSIRQTDGKTYLTLQARRDCIVFVGEGATLKTEKMKLSVLSGKPQFFTMSKGENGYAEIQGVHEYFEYAEHLTANEEEENPAANTDAPLFKPVPRHELPSMILPPKEDLVPFPRDPGQRGPAWLDGTIEPMEKPEEQPVKRGNPSVRHNGPVASKSQARS